MKCVLSLAVAVLVAVLFQDVSSFRLAGGMTEEKPATSEIQEMANEVREAVERKLNRKFKIFKPVSYATQVVAGTNYFIKVKVSEVEYVHIRVFQPLPYTGRGPELSRAIDMMKETDPLRYI